MKDLRTLIKTAAAAPPVERHEAFAEIVARFQDLAFGCAWAVLKDFHLAEEAAQEAFIIAWQELDTLREPEAFPGWLRRLVLTACHRMTRGKRLIFVPLEAAAQATAAAADPHARAERSEMQARVRAAIRELPERERMVTTLFYIGEYSQAEISAFLELPVTTIVKRLYSARQRLKGRMLDMFRDDLKSHRPSRDESFAEEVSSRLRPFAAEDWEPVSAFVYNLAPDFRQDDEAWLRNRRQFDESRYKRRQYIAEHDETGEMLGYGSIEQTIYLPRYRLFLFAEPRWLQAGVGELLLNRLTDDLREAGAILVWHRNYAEQTAVLEFLTERGFAETYRLWDLRLNLNERDFSAFDLAQEQFAERGLTITTFSEESARDPEALRKLHEFLNTVKADDPQRQPYMPAPYEAAEQWRASKAFLPDAAFIAKAGDRYIGFTDLIRYELLPGGIAQGFTGVAREYRRQGVATVLKLRAIEWARAQGCQTIRAFIYPSQPAALALNEKLGFRRAHGYVTLEQMIERTVTLDPQMTDAYVGRYAPEPEALREHGLPANLTGTIRQVGDRLWSEIRDMQDELFAASETEFFTDHHYARITFVKDERGEVTHLLYRQGGMTLRANKVK